MASSITIEGIDTALQNLGYYTKSSPKSKFLNTIRSFYKNSEDLNKIEQIPIETIVSSIWEIAPNDKSRINSRKKNALSLKNTINKDLQKLFDSGLNSEGIIINENNIFAMSDNAREKLLTSFTAPFSGENDVSLSQISQVLSSIKDFLEKTRQKDNTQSDFQNIQSLISEIEKNFTDKSDTPGDQPGSGDKESGSAKGGGSDSYENDEVESSGKRTVTIELDEDEEIEEVFEDDTESDDTEIVEVEDEEAINTEEVTEDDLQEEFDDELTEEAEDDSDILELEDDEELIDSNEETEEAEFQEEVIDDELIEEVEDDLDEEDLVTDIDEDIIDDSDILELEDDEELIDSNEETEEAEFQEEVIDDEKS
ncbi:MAG: hypothetical protein H6681_02915 [Desulfobacteraceae bacterium]|nr:hypothetical protein [Desulfobacteraceae bacterium]